MPERIRAAGRALLAALTFLTIVPIGRGVRLGGSDVARGTPALPLVGALLGAAAGAVCWLAAAPTGPLAAAVLAVATVAVATGALHLDGLADTADGMGGRTVPDRLRIMRDHSVGAYGVVALVLALLTKTAATYAVGGRIDAVAAWASAGALSRAAGPALAAAMPYVQLPGGSGSVLSSSGAGRRAMTATALAVGLAVALLGTEALPAAVAAGAVTLAVAVWARRTLGGVSGDVLGAVTELVEIGVLLVVIGRLQ